jgi:NADPH-ferrihemoprotein reductase
MVQGLDRSCRHVELDISGTNIRYMAGDHVAVFPTNDAAMVEELGTQLGVNLDEVFSLEAVDSGAKRAPFPVPCTYRTAFSHYLVWGQAQAMRARPCAGRAS